MEQREQILADFLNQGVLPFVGEEFLERLLRFWRESGTGRGVRSFLVEGEAGSGKSRLLEELRGRGGDDLSLFLHLRFLEGGHSSPTALLDTTLRAESSRRKLPGAEEQDGRSPIDRLCQLSRLRRTLLVLEDLHTLDPDALGELTRMLELLGDEPIAVLVLSRPSSQPIAGMLDRWPTERAGLDRWGERELEEIWRALLGVPPEKEHLILLERLSSGLPLAVRALLRDWIGEDERGEMRGDRFEIDEMERRGERIVREIGRGLAVGLTDEEGEGAGQLAWLGEIVAQETATELLSLDTLDRLRFRGLLHRTHLRASTLPGLSIDPVDYPESDEELLTFSHVLLKRSLQQSTPPPIVPLARTIASGLPLHSYEPITPILQALAAPNSESLAAELNLRDLLWRISNILHDLALSRSWRDAVVPIELLARVLEHHGEALEPMTHRSLQISLCYKRGILAESQGNESDHREAIDRARQLCTEVEGEEMVRYRLGLLVKDPSVDWRDPESIRRIYEEGVGLVDRYPDSNRSIDYAMFLCALAIFARDLPDQSLFREIEEHCRLQIAAFDDLAIRRRLETLFLPIVIQQFTTREELRKRREEYGQIRSLPRVDSLAAHVLDHEIMFLYDCGDAERALGRIDRGVELFRLRSSYRLVAVTLGRKVVLMSALGRSSDAINAALEEGCRLLEGNEENQAVVAAHGVVAEWSVGGEGWREVLERFPGAVHHLPEPFTTLAEGENGGLYTPPEEELLRTDQIAGHLLALHLATELRVPEDRAELIDSLQQIKGWILERGAFGWSGRLLEVAERLLQAKDLKLWRGEVADAERRGRAAEDRLLVEVIDRFCVVGGRGEERAITGGRMKGVLALLVVGEITGRRGTLEEFSRLVAGEDDPDPESARNNLYVRLHGLRKILGAESILSEKGEAPRLNRESVRVDLLEALDKVAEGTKEAERGNLLAGIEGCRTGLDVIGSGVPFPNLYDPVIEAARDQSEVLLRNGLLTTAGLALAAEDHQSILTLLRRAHQRMPEDEEITALLIEALEGEGELIEAAFLRE